MTIYLLWGIIAYFFGAILFITIVAIREKPPRCKLCGGRLFVKDWDTIVCGKCKHETSVADFAP
jgi:ribosomal protein S27AE